jgi:hypothetical protein
LLSLPPPNEVTVIERMCVEPLYENVTLDGPAGTVNGMFEPSGTPPWP